MIGIAIGLLGFAGEPILSSTHLQSDNKEFEAEISCVPVTASIASCKIQTFAKKRMSRAPGGACPFEKAAEAHQINVSLDFSKSEAHSESASGPALSFKYDQQKIVAFSYNGTDFNHEGNSDPCEEYLKETMAKAANSLPNFKPILRTTVDTGRYEGVQNKRYQIEQPPPGVNPSDPNLGKQ